MARRRLEVADVVRAHRDDLVASRGGRLSGAERRVLDDIAACRTAARGGHVERCDQCGHQRIAYNSCRNRHCPKCQETARAEWTADREREVLPVEYFHVAFTIPHELAAIALQNKKVVYNILFKASGETLREIARDSKHLGAEIGVLAVLHTWGQTLEHHPHIHCLVPGGGLSRDGTEWIPCRPGFFLPVRVLSKLFRGKFLYQLRMAFDRGELRFHRRLAELANRVAFESLLETVSGKKWRVYSKPPFGRPELVLRYLARYTHRVAISNARLVALRAGHVTFLWKDYRKHCRSRTMTLGAVQFMRRFLLHLLPRGFVRIRTYGFLANRHRASKLAQCRWAIAQIGMTTGDDAGSDLGKAAADDKLGQCPACRHGRMSCVLMLSAADLLLGSRVVAMDSS
ncbi:MAG: IS91 family transposase [bacterium]|nr:IS91 family transposase [bacterium]